MAGDRCLVVDLEGCTGMDSTFMGTLAGMAARLSSHEGGTLQIANAGDRNRRSLEDLGLDFLIEIDPPNNEWSDRITTIRASLKSPQALVATDLIQRAEHVLEAHQILSETNEKNARVFANVVTLLQEDLAEKTQSTTEPRPS